jgi:hypothetical protein
MTTRRLTIMFVLEAVAFAWLAFALLDRRTHQRVQTEYGFNQWGYRDEPRGSKEPGERRVALIGGSALFEAGLLQPRTLTSNLFIELRAAGAPDQQQYSVANLAEPGASADSYAGTIHHYAFLDPDVICIFDGYDMPAAPPIHGRRHSLAFLAVGYLPILPAKLMGSPGWLSDADGGVAEMLKDKPNGAPDVSCAGASSSYCAAMAAAVRAGLEQGRAVMVVSPPSVSAQHARQQGSLGAALGQEFGRNPAFAYLDLGSVMNLSDPELSPDGLHRTDIGNHVVGQRIASALLKWPAFVHRR